MQARSKFLGVGVAFLGLAVLVVAAVTALYWPFQAVVQVVLPFLIAGVFAAVGLSSLLGAYFLPVKMFDAPLAGTPRWADWLSIAAVGFAVLGLLIAVTFPGPLNPATSDPAFVSGYAVVTGCHASPAATTFEIHYTNTGAAAASGVVARYVAYALNATTQSYTGTVPIGSVEARTSGSIAVTAPMACGPYGADVSVSFTWS